MRAVRAIPCFAMAWIVGCGGNVSIAPTGTGAGGGADGGAAGAGVGGSSPSGGTGGADSGISGGSGGAPDVPDSGVKLCGCKKGSSCAPDQWCDFEETAYCGIGDTCGVCRSRPDPSSCPPPDPVGCEGSCGCGKDYTTCGCDGAFYCSADCAHLAGADDNPNCELTPPSGLCSDIDAALAAQFTAPLCTTVVRLDYESYVLKSYAIVCGKGPWVDEGAARLTAQDDTGFGQGTNLSGQNPQDEYVFFSEPGDFGGASAVSVATGLTVFGGSIVWMGTGEINYPHLWRPGNELGYCGGIPPANPPVRGFDLGNSVADWESQVEPSLAQVMQTELPNGLQLAGHQIANAVVLLYPRTVGVFEPSTAERIVILNSGLLE